MIEYFSEGLEQWRNDRPRRTLPRFATALDYSAVFTSVIPTFLRSLNGRVSHIISIFPDNTAALAAFVCKHIPHHSHTLDLLSLRNFRHTWIHEFDKLYPASDSSAIVGDCCV